MSTADISAMPGAHRTGASHEALRRLVPLLTRLLVEFCWVAFLIIASTLLNGFGVDKSERLALLPAYPIALLLVANPRSGLLQELGRNKLLMSWPLLAIISTLWSLAPKASAYFGFQLLMTIVIALMLHRALPRGRALQLMFVSLVVIQVISAAVSIAKPGIGIGEFGEWRGSFTHKNTLGGLMSLHILVSICLLVDGWRRPLVAASMVSAVGLLLLSRSGTALASLLVALAIVPYALGAHARRPIWHALLSLSCLFLAGLMLACDAYGVGLEELALRALGKDQTLTGRTLLWQIGMDAINTHPLLGYGYKGFWEGALDRVTYLRLVIGQDLWFFHNVYIETGVAFGVPGMILFAGSLLLFLWWSIRGLLRRLDGTSLWSVCFLIFMIVYVSAENPLFETHNLYQILIGLAVASVNDVLRVRRTVSSRTSIV